MTERAVLVPNVLAQRLAFLHTRHMSKLPDHINENRRYWDGMADQWIAEGERAWASRVPYWGNWGVPNDECPMLPEDMTGMTAIELGCGTGYVSAWMARRGANVTAIDNSERQLATARRLASEYHIDDAMFDFAISEYGAAIWCDPETWIPEAYRLLTPGGKLVFLGNSPLSMICTPMDGAPVDRALHRDYFTLGRLDWTRVPIDPGGIAFNMSLSAWFTLFRRVGFRVDDYKEPVAPVDKHGIESCVPAEWAQSYPSEQVWFLTRV